MDITFEYAGNIVVCVNYVLHKLNKYLQYVSINKYMLKSIN